MRMKDQEQNKKKYIMYVESKERVVLSIGA